jgi:PAS domain S-box-containing protein
MQQAGFKPYLDIFPVSSAAMLITDANFKIMQINTAFCTTTGFNQAEMQANCMLNLFDLFVNSPPKETILNAIIDNNYWRGELGLWQKYNKNFPAIVLIDPIRETKGTINGYFALFIDISEHQQRVNELRYHAEIDPLTGLANRKLFFQHLDTDLALAKRFNDNLAVTIQRK